jgi:xanthine dehydrogenase small subunit
MARQAGSDAILSAVHFLLGDRVTRATVADPTQTVLEWLRANGRVGTKEGCAEGDCGACTVALGELQRDGTVVYRAVNACILFVPELAGKHLVTVEDLAGPDGTLHPVQQALVDCHASQCGFCTPGFVMSLFALFHQEAAADRDTICDALAGNLCRCTGYRPIVDAARKSMDGTRSDQFSRGQAITAEKLRDLHSTGAVEGSGTRYFVPRSLGELSDLFIRQPDAVLLAGGTDVGLWVTKEQRRLATVISLNAVRELQDIVETPDTIDIGAGVTYSRLLPLFERHWPSFGEMLRRLGSVQIRNSGTMGGNIANGSPIGDSMPALIALRAGLMLNRGGEQRTIAIEDFFLDYRKTALKPGEFVARIRVPLDPDWRFATYKVSKRYDQDISAVAIGIGLALQNGVVTDIRIAFGGMAAIPKRAVAVEEALRDEEWTLASVANAAARLGEDFQPITDMRASGDYRLHVARNLLIRFYRESVGEPMRLGQAVDG